MATLPRNRFKIDHKGMAMILISPEMHALALYYANKGKAYAIAISPEPSERKWTKNDPGHYVDKFEMHSMVKNLTKKFPTRRAAVELVNVSRYAEAVETGWQRGIGIQPDNPIGHHVFSQTHTYLHEPRRGPR